MSTGTRHGVTFALCLLLSASSLSCAAASGRLYVAVGPPAPIVDIIPVVPGPGFVWLEGYYRWDGRAYVWVPGRWARPPRARARWIPGHWVHDRRGWYFVEGHWH
jgi:hypothetical protein